MSTLPLSKLEAYELLEHLRETSSLWTYSHDMWLRTNGDADVLMAIRFSNGQPNGMYVMHVRALKDPDAEQYALWLRNKFTSYPEREQLETLLAEKCKAEVDIAELALQIQNLQNAPLPDVLDVTGTEEPVPVIRIAQVASTSPIVPTAPSPVAAAGQSRYLRNLIKQGKK